MRVFAGIARAVDAAHKVGVIHKDIKPANILIREAAAGDPQPILSDFGIGEVRGVNAATPTTLDKHDTAIGNYTTPITQGTRMYSSPELSSGQHASIASDMYSLGVLLYQLAVGDFSKPLAIGWERDIASPILRSDIRACVEGNPAERIASASELALRVERLKQREIQEEKRKLSRAIKKQSRISLELTAIILIPVLVMISLTVYALYGQLLNYSSTRLHLLAQTTAQRLEDQLRALRQDASQLAASAPVVRMCTQIAAASGTGPAEGSEAVTQLLHAAVETHREYQLALVVDTQGKIIATTDKIILGRDLAFREYVRDALGGSPQMSGMIFGSYIREPGVFACTPVFDPLDDGLVIGAVLLKLTAERVWEIADQVKIGRRGFTMLVDENNVVIFHPDREKMFHSLSDLTPDKVARIDPDRTYARTTIKSLDIPELATPPQRVGQLLVFSTPAAESGEAESDDPEAREYWTAGYRRLSDRAWYVYCVEPQAQFFKPITDMLRREAIIGGIVLVIAIVLIFIRTRRVARLQFKDDGAPQP